MVLLDRVSPSARLKRRLTLIFIQTFKFSSFLFLSVKTVSSWIAHGFHILHFYYIYPLPEESKEQIKERKYRITA
jgi:hypothetical protein